MCALCTRCSKKPKKKRPLSPKKVTSSYRSSSGLQLIVLRSRNSYFSILVSTSNSSGFVVFRSFYPSYFYCALYVQLACSAGQFGRIFNSAIGLFLVTSSRLSRSSRADFSDSFRPLINVYDTSACKNNLVHLDYFLAGALSVVTCRCPTSCASASSTPTPAPGSSASDLPACRSGITAWLSGHGTSGVCVGMLRTSTTSGCTSWHTYWYPFTCCATVLEKKEATASTCCTEYTVTEDPAVGTRSVATERRYDEVVKQFRRVLRGGQRAVVSVRHYAPLEDGLYGR